MKTRVLAVIFLSAESVLAAPCQKLIYHGHDLFAATTESVYRNREKFAATGIDGLAMPLTGVREDGSCLSGMDLMTTMGWRDAYFANSVQLLREMTSSCEGLKESLAMTLWCPRKEALLHWKDDAAWAAFASNMAVLGRVAKVSGLKGIQIDHEDYWNGDQFKVRGCGLSCEESARLARQRGRQVFEAFFREFPDAEVLSFWMFDEVATSYVLSSPDPQKAILAKGNLWPAFLNGMLEVIPSAAKMIDGCETFGYKAEAATYDFHRYAWDMIRGCERLVDGSLKSKYRGALSVSFGQYLDKFINPETSKYYFAPRGGSRLAHFSENLSEALRLADDCIWLYGEKATIIDWDVKNHKHLQKPTWEEKLPGIGRVCRLLTGKDVLEKDLGKEFWPNPDCDTSDGGIPAPFTTWTGLKDPPEDLFAYDPAEGASKPGALRVNGNGSYTAAIDGLSCGEILSVSVMVKGDRPCVSTGWRKGTTWLWEERPQCVIVPNEKPSSEWRRCAMTLVVPFGVDSFGLILGTCADSKESVWFDDVHIRK